MSENWSCPVHAVLQWGEHFFAWVCFAWPGEGINKNAFPVLASKIFWQWKKNKALCSLQMVHEKLPKVHTLVLKKYTEIMCAFDSGCWLLVSCHHLHEHTSTNKAKCAWPSCALCPVCRPICWPSWHFMYNNLCMQSNYGRLWPPTVGQSTNSCTNDNSVSLQLPLQHKA